MKPHLLRTLVFTFSFSLFTSNLHSQWVPIPDPEFADFLIIEYGNCMLGNDLDTTCADIVNETVLDLNGWQVTDVTGVRFFDNLQVFYIWNNPIVDITELPRNLQQLYCGGLDYLETLPALPNSLLVLDCRATALTTLPALPPNLRELNCSSNYLIALSTVPSSLRVLDCSYTGLPDLTVLPSGLTSLSCSNTNFNSGLPSLPASLNHLNCEEANLVSLPALPATLDTLICSFNSLTSLPSLPAGLKLLNCDGNVLGSLPALPNGIKELYCGSDSLTSLPALGDSLTIFSCEFNQITNLPALPSTLKVLWCQVNELSAIPALPNGLTMLICDRNNITAFPPLPDSLTTLTCHNNELVTLPALPAVLRSLVCYSNQLTAIPALPDSLFHLRCFGNQITSLPAMPKKLLHLNCSGNQLTSLPEMPVDFNELYCNDNPNLTCLPKITRLSTLNFSNTGITCISGYPIQINNCFPPLNSLPQCDVFNGNGCDIYWNISGKSFVDANNNCLKEASDTALRNMKVILSSGGSVLEQVFTTDGGLYSFDTYNNGNYQVSIDTSNIPLHFLCPANNLHQDTITALDSLDYDKDFVFECYPGFDLFGHVINGRFRPGDLSDVDISAGDITAFYGSQCASGVSGVVTVTINGPITYTSPADGGLTPIVSGNTLTYNIGDFGTVDYAHGFDILVQTDTFAQIGQQVCFTVSVTPTADNNPSNNTHTNCFTVVGSYDPNDKAAYPAGDIDTAQEWLTYTVRFQNTGTAEAQHIYVDDTLDTDLDYSTFQLLAYSHQPLVQIKENVVRFNFPNINLPDSGANEPLSHGYVQYKIKLKENLAIGTEINNTAYIYFDFNEPVVTNTTTNTIAVVSSTSDIGHPSPVILLFPNPATNHLNINLGGMQAERVRIYNTDGRLVSDTKQPAYNSIDISSLAKGVYVAEVTTPKSSGGAFDNTVRVRWVKM